MKLLSEPGYTRISKFIGEIFPMSKPTYYRGVKAGLLPGPVSLTPNIRGIPNCDINRHILKLHEAAEAEEAKKQLQAEVKAKEQGKAPEQQDEEEEAEETAE